MVKIFDPTPASRMRLEKALARLDAARVRKQKAARAKALALREKRKRERREAARTPVRTIGQAVPVLRRIQPLAGWKVLCARMEPGTWYTAGQLKAMMPEYAKGSLRAWIWQRLPKEGLIARAGNPDYDPAKLQPGQPGERYLYSLTEMAAELAAGWRCELGMCEDTGKRETGL